MKKLSERLTEERERLGSLRAAARAMGVATGTYEGWENGWRQPRGISEFQKIEAFLGVERPITLFWSGLLTEEQAKKLTKSSTRARGVLLNSAMSMAAA